MCVSFNIQQVNQIPITIQNGFVPKLEQNLNNFHSTKTMNGLRGKRDIITSNYTRVVFCIECIFLLDGNYSYKIRRTNCVLVDINSRHKLLWTRSFSKLVKSENIHEKHSLEIVLQTQTGFNHHNRNLRDHSQMDITHRLQTDDQHSVIS